MTIPESVTTINSFAFEFCTNLTSITIPESVTYIGEYAFSACTSLMSVTGMEAVTTIGKYAFSNCQNLTSVTISASVTAIGDGAFTGCSKLTEIILDENNNHFVTLDRLLYSKDISTLHRCPVDVTSVAIPASVTVISSGAFYSCTNLTSVTGMESVTTIGSHAFYHCKNLTSITLPEAVTTIGYGAFIYCENLTNVNIPKSVTSLNTQTFYECHKLKEIKIPSSVTTIENAVFSRCESLTELVIPSSVVSMGLSLVLGCINLKDFYIEDGFIPIEIKYEGWIRNYFKELYIGRSVITDRSYGDPPFIDDDTGLEKVTFSQFVTSVDDIGMYNAKDLKTVVVRGRTPPTITDDFFSTNQYNNATLYVPEGTYDTYTKATGWRYFYNIVEGMPTGVSQVESPAKTTVTAGDGCIMVSNAKGAIRVYTSAGTLVKSATASGDTEITVPGHGVYIVKTGGETVKVSL